MTVTKHPILPPTIALPPIDKIHAAPIAKLFDCVCYLRLLYNPEVRGSRRVKRVKTLTPASISSYEATGAVRDEELELLRSDKFERSYAIRWLTALIAQIEFLELDSSLPDHSDDAPHEPTWESVIQTAASILAICAGSSASGSLTRSLRLGGGARSREVVVQLTDAPLENHDFGTVGVQTWGSACVMAEMVVDMPGHFGLDFAWGKGEGINVDSGSENVLRLLELGAGTGLVSLTLGKFFQGQAPQCAVDIIASDFHPSVLANLRTNIAANFLPSSSASRSITLSAGRLDWSDAMTSELLPAPFDKPFDIIFGADVIYEVDHALWIKECLKKLLKRPSPSPTFANVCGDIIPPPRFHLMTPLRPTHSLESSTIESVFPHLEHICGLSDQAPTLCISCKETILCEAEPGVAGEVEYAYYIIEWTI
ncbi:hypothetical protein EW146_g2313 [Bondarzewia mesenterica]|uniref:FAM86 N-terminal domain-containing protein n=1 Tax=Bondarzewia mesenterica TaxID=1095465 RepID=A0A4S4M3D0_9AGAM|nr:hypothetical protein EW146_g2313 [Bondarzewia mesenterica]